MIHIREDKQKALARTVGLGTLLCAVTISVGAESQSKVLTFVGDATLTYASYVFLLPRSNWTPGVSRMDLTHQRGIWRARHRASEVYIQVVPTKKEPGQKTLADFARVGGEQIVEQGGCSAEALRKNALFKPKLGYSYEVYSLSDCPQGTYGVIVFAELPEHVITFNLYGKGKDDTSLDPYLQDFEEVIASFRWTLGLSDEEIAATLKTLE